MLSGFHDDLPMQAVFIIQNHAILQHAHVKSDGGGSMFVSLATLYAGFFTDS